METILKSCPESRRNLEWHLLNSFCHQELFSIERTGDQFGRTSWSSDGRVLLVFGQRSAEIWNVDEKRIMQSIPIHGGGPCAVCWARNLIATGYSKSKGSIDLVGLGDGKQIRSLTISKFNGPSELYLEIDPQGRWLVGARDDLVCVWDLNSGAMLNSWRLDELRDRSIRSIKIHPLEPWLVTLSVREKSDEHLSIATMWDIPSGNRVRDFIETDGNKWLFSCDFSLDGKWLLTGTFRDPRAAIEEEIAIWDVASGEKSGQVRGHKGGIMSVGFHPNRPEIITTGYSDSMIGIREQTDKGQFLSDTVRKYRSHGKISGALFNPEGTRFTTNEDGIVRIWDYFKDQGPLVFAGHPGGGVFSVAISPDGSKVATGGSSGIVKLVDIESGRELREYFGLETEREYVVFGLAFSPDGKRLAGVGRGMKKQGVLWDVESGAKIAELTVDADESNSNPRDIASVAFDPNSNSLVTGGSGKLIRVWDATNGELTNEWPLETSKTTHLAFSPDGRLCVVGEPVVEGGDWLTAYCDPSTGTLTRIFNSSLAPCRVVFSNDPVGRWIAFGDSNKKIRIFDSRTGIEKATFTGHDHAVKSMAFHPNGNRIISCGDDKTVRIWDLETGREVLTRHDHPGAVESLSISPDGRKMVTGGWGNTTFIWDIGPQENK
jgi:WD40 repeat protein